MTDLTGAHWRRSSRSDGHGGECVELADIGSSVAVRDSKNPDGPHLTFGRATLSAFVEKVRDGS
ncbi:DUF397 domain-containing protein [Spirillospora sp. NPDC047279]|uniref:DUF397 domain-containing protein n=1 Tax=Spirillospora sp. NPDC047279 TaxID=3155478 RepID=UPI0033CAD416